MSAILLRVNAWSYEPFEFYIPNTASLDEIKEQISIRTDEPVETLQLFNSKNTPLTLEDLQQPHTVSIRCDIEPASGYVNLVVSQADTKKHITVLRDTTIQHLKQMVSTGSEETVACCQWKVLPNDTTLTEIRNCSSIYFGPADYQVGSPNTQIFIRVAGGVTLSFYVDFSRPIADLVEMLKIRYGIPTETLRIMWGGRMLIAGNTFNDYRISPYDNTVLSINFLSLGGSGVIPLGSTRIGDPPVKAKKKREL